MTAADRYALLRAVPHYPVIRRAVGTYLRTCVPDYVENAGVRWAITALPHTGGGRLFTLNVGQREAMWAWPLKSRGADSPQISMLLDVPADFVKMDDTVVRLKPTTNYSNDHVVNATGPLDHRFTETIFEHRRLTALAKQHSDRMIQVRRTCYARYHNPFLADDVCSAATEVDGP